MADEAEQQNIYETGLKIDQITASPNNDGSHSIFALCANGTLWRGYYDAFAGTCVWTQVPLPQPPGP